MSSGLLICFATLLEAGESITLLKANSIGKNIWEFSKGRISVTGMGMYHALFGLSKVFSLNRPKAIWNLGFAADLKDREIGTLIEVNTLCRPVPFARCDQRTHRIHRNCYPEIALNLRSNHAKLMTVDAPIHNITQRKQCAVTADLIDMEGYALGAFARFHQVDCRILKIISDRAQKQGRKDLFANASMLALKLAHWLVKELN